MVVGRDSERGPVDLDAARTALSRQDAGLARLIAERPGFDPHEGLAELPVQEPFSVLLFQIVGQQISVPSTRAILARLTTASGGRLPEPRELLALDGATVLGAGVSHRKLATMQAAARVFVERRLGPRRLAAMTDDEVVAVLTAVPGIGPWTAQGFLVIALDRPDAFPAGDLAIRRAVRDLYDDPALPSEQEVEALAERWRPHRALAAGYLISWDAARAHRSSPGS